MSTVWSEGCCWPKSVGDGNDVKCKINFLILFNLKLNQSIIFFVFFHASLSIFNVEFYYNNSPLAGRGEIPLNSDSVLSPKVYIIAGRSCWNMFLRGKS